MEGLDLAQYRADRFRLKGTERLLQETVEAARSDYTEYIAALEKYLSGRGL